jgi:ribosomal protein L35AE/L33A
MRGPSKIIIVATQSATFFLVIPTVSGEKKRSGISSLGISIIWTKQSGQEWGLLVPGEVVGHHGDIGRLRASELPGTALSGKSPRRSRTLTPGQCRL